MQVLDTTLITKLLALVASRKRLVPLYDADYGEHPGGAPRTGRGNLQKCNFVLMAAVAMALEIPGPTAAQTAGVQPEDLQDPKGLQEVIVTAQKRAENLQKVPISVAAVSGSTMEKLGITDLSTLSEVVPGFQFGFALTNPQLTIRGVTNYSNGPAVDSAVATYIDGVYQENNQAAIFPLNDVEQVSVLEGPQGTLFGRNALAGTVSITTLTPSHTPSLDLDVGYGNFDTFTEKFYGTTGITANLAADVSVYVQNQSEGWGTDTYDSSQLHFGLAQGIRSKWVWAPGDDTTVTFAGNYYHDEPPEVGAETMRDLYSFVTLGPPHTGGYYDSYLPEIGYMDMTQYGGAVTVDQGLGWGQFVSISSVTYDETGSSFTRPPALPFNPQDPSEGQEYAGYSLRGNEMYDTKTYTQEFQLKSPQASTIKWIAGAFILNDRLGNLAFRENVGSALTETVDSLHSQSYAGYGQVTVPIFLDTRLTLGARLTSDREQLEGNVYTADGVVIPKDSVISNPEPSVTWNEPTYTAIIDHDFSKGMMGYLSYTRGYQSGDYSLSSSVDTRPVNPETIDASEIGLKTSGDDNRLRVNSALYYYKINNLIVSQNIDSVNVSTNAAAARIEGLNLDADYLPVQNLMFSASVTWQNPEYTSYHDAEFYEPNAAGTEYITTEGDATGRQIQYAEKFVASFSATYQISTAVGDFSLNGNENYNSANHFDPQGLLVEPSYSLVNVSLKWTLPDASWDVKLWSDNLTNTQYATFFANSPVMYMNPNPPRTYGIEFGYHWEKQ